MQRLKCIKADPELDVTQDKEYDMEGESIIHYQIRGDRGILLWVFKKHFKPTISSVAEHIPESSE